MEVIITRAMNLVPCAIPLFLLTIVCTSCALTSGQIQQATSVQNQAVVFDIDGTLTSRVHAIRTARDGAAEAVQAYADAGCRIIYLSARVAAGIVTVSEKVKRDLVKLYRIPPERIAVTHLAVDHAAFRPRPAAEVEAVRARHRLPERFVLYAAASLPHKNHARLLKALKILKDGGDIDYVGASAVELVGPGESAGNYREIEIKDGAISVVKFR